MLPPCFASNSMMASARSRFPAMLHSQFDFDTE
jgi:hypothetical protein